MRARVSRASPRASASVARARRRVRASSRVGVELSVARGPVFETGLALQKAATAPARAGRGARGARRAARRVEGDDENVLRPSQSTIRAHARRARRERVL